MEENAVCMPSITLVFYVSMGSQWMLRDEKLAAKVNLRWTEQPKPAQDQEVNIWIGTKKKKKKRMEKKTAQG